VKSILAYDGSHLLIVLLTSVWITVFWLSRRDLISMFMLLQIEGPALVNGGFSAAISKVGLQKFVSDLFWVGMFYHLYNQVRN
jgi:hypothetical protein